MPGQKNLIPTEGLHVYLPVPEMTKLVSHLYSDLDGRVPKGAYQSFFTARLREYFSWKHLDLAPYSGSPPGAFIVSGTPETIEALKRTLKGEVPL
jgi:hypothetical protein